MKEEIKERIEVIRSGEAPDGYVRTEYGVFPSHWRLAELREIAQPLTETAGTRKIETVSISAGIGFVNQAEKFGKELSGKQYEKYIVLHRGDFSYNKGNSNLYPQGCIYRLNDRDIAAVPNVFESFRIVDGDPDYYEQLFLSGFLNHQLYRKINHGVRDDGLLNLTEVDFYSCVLPVPPIKEQHRIAEILSACERLRALHQATLSEAKEMKKSFLNQMFPKDGACYPKLRFIGFTSAWEPRKVGNATEEFQSGKFIAAADIDEAGEYPVYGSNGLRGYCNTYNHDGDYALIGRQGALCGNMNYSHGKAYFTEHAVAVRANASSNTKFLYYMLDKMNLGKYSDQSAQPGLAVGKLVKLESMFPSKQEQDRIAEFLTDIDNTITLHQREVELQQNKKKALMQLLLTGLVPVS